MSREVWVGVIVSLVLVLAGVWGDQRLRESQPNSRPAYLRVGVLPDQTPESLSRRYTPLLEHLSARLGVRCELVTPDSYEGLLALFKAGEIDLAWFGGVTSVHARRDSDARLLVMRDVDTRFTSVFLTQAKHGGLSLPEFRGRRFAFGAKLSTSGHLMPRFFLNGKGLDPEAAFSEVRYSGAHDATALLVQSGTVDLGVANAQVVASMFADGRLSPDEVVVVWETPPYPDYVWAVHAELAPDFRQELLDAFLDLSAEDEAQARILARLRCDHFLPAVKADFGPLERVMQTSEQ